MNEAPSPRATRIIWTALLVSQAIYLGIPVHAGTDGAPAICFIALGAIATSEAVAVVTIFRVACVARIQSGRLDPDVPEGAARLFTLLVVSWALTESVAIYGLVLRMLGASLAEAAPFALGALGLMAFTHPWQAGLRAPVGGSERGRDPTPIV